MSPPAADLRRTITPSGPASPRTPFQRGEFGTALSDARDQRRTDEQRHEGLE